MLAKTKAAGAAMKAGQPEPYPLYPRAKLSSTRATWPAACCLLQCTADEYEQIARELVKIAQEGEGLPKLFRLGFHVSGHWSASGLNGGPNGGWHQ